LGINAEAISEGTRRIKKGMIIRVMQRIIDIWDPTINEMIKEELITVSKEFGKRFGYHNKGIIELLRNFSENPQELLPSLKKTSPIKKS
jgi:hypothetical protein